MNFKVITFPLLGLLFTSLAHGAPLTNGGFELGLAGWTVGGGTPTNPNAYTGDPVVPPHSGAWAVDLGPSGVAASNHGFLTQTVVVAAGIYTLDFWHRVEATGGPVTSPFRLDISGGASFTANLISTVTYQLYDYVFAASAGALTITFTDTQTIESNSIAYNTILDDVSLTPAAVPEPGSLLLVAIGGLGYLTRKRRQNRS